MDMAAVGSLNLPAAFGGGERGGSTNSQAASNSAHS